LTPFQDRLAFFVATDALKETRRANWMYSEPRQETVAEHVWHTTLLAMLLADVAPTGIDHNHVRDMLIIHDLVEVYAGDTVLWDDVPDNDVVAREQAAGERLVGLLPRAQQSRIDPLWREFQAQETQESRWARSIDALHPMVMSWFPGARGHANKTLTPTRILTRKRPFLEPFPPIWELARWLVGQAVKQRLIPGDEMMPGEDISSLLATRLDFFVAADLLKQERRANHVLSAVRTESVAEHCWHTMLLGLLCEDLAPAEVDIDRVLDLLLIHDLVEVYAGDTPVHLIDDAAAVQLSEDESAAALLEMLPADPVRDHFAALIAEFQAFDTANARFAKALDALHPSIMTWGPGSHVHPDYIGNPPEDGLILGWKRPYIADYPELWSWLLDTIETQRKSGAILRSE